MFIKERYEVLLKLIKEKGFISYEELAKKTFCSESTVRRDINEMANQGLITKIYGGASVIESNSDESSTIIRQSENIDKKRIIAEHAIKLINDGASLFLDSSTTVSQLVPLLKDFRRSFVVTNSLNNALLLSNNTYLDVYVIGGSLQRRTNSMGGVTSIDSICAFNCDFAFISCKGINNSGDITDASFETQKTKQLMVTNAKKTVLLVDSSKFGSTYLLTTLSIKDIDIIITDKKPDADFVKLCTTNNIELIY